MPGPILSGRPSPSASSLSDSAKFLALILTIAAIALVGLFAYERAAAETIVYDEVSDWHVDGLPAGYFQTCVTIDGDPYLMIYNSEGTFELFKIL